MNVNTFCSKGWQHLCHNFLEGKEEINLVFKGKQRAKILYNCEMENKQLKTTHQACPTEKTLKQPSRAGVGDAAYDALGLDYHE